MKIDSLRIIEHTNTQVRCLPIITQIIRVIGKRSYPQSILKDILLKWSEVQYNKSEYYKKHNGILSKKENEKFESTTAFKYYLEFCESLGLIIRIGEIIRCSKLGLLFYSINEEFDNDADISTSEKLLYLFFLLSQDADNIILVMEQLRYKSMNQTQIRNIYEDELKFRLKHKMKNVEPMVSSKIMDKYRTVEYEWKNTKEYSKHIVPPRLEWLVDLGICSIDKNKNYSLSVNGVLVFESFPSISKNFRDINSEWLNSFFALTAFKIFFNSSITPILEIQTAKDLVIFSFDKLDNDGIKRVSANILYLHVMFRALLKYKIPVSWEVMVQLFKDSFEIGNNKFDLRLTGRLNESYFTRYIIS